MLKRKDSMMVRGEGDKLEVTPLGAGNEVGRSCVYMTYKGKTVMVRSAVDCSFVESEETRNSIQEQYGRVLLIFCLV